MMMTMVVINSNCNDGSDDSDTTHAVNCDNGGDVDKVN